MTTNINILSELHWRGLVNQTTEGLNDLLQTPQVVYLGVDPTGNSLHVGHLLALTVLRRFQRAGHRVIVVIGGATGMIGDPSGKSEERKLLEFQTILENVTSVKEQIEQLIPLASVVNNHDWMRGYYYLDFLRDVGKHFPVNVMLTKDSVKSRMESGLSYTEFSYMLLQAYDFVYLNQWHGCTLQIGGSDQWGNITAGIDLCRRMRGVELHGLTIPLLTKSDGTKKVKMGKTERGALWLDAEKTSPYDFYQYWLNVADEDVERCLKYFTDLDANEINCLIQRHRSDPSKRIAQRRLATGDPQIGRLMPADYCCNALAVTGSVTQGDCCYQTKPLSGIHNRSSMRSWYSSLPKGTGARPSNDGARTSF
ncbi:MAG: tyrosine--tRNA ligase [Thermoguttaceae bacterium]